MTLLEYLYSHRLTIKQFAEKLGVSPSYLSNLINGKHKFSKRLKYIIEKETNGQVKL